MTVTKENITKLAVDFINNTPLNAMGAKFPNEKIWEEPLLGFASGKDSIFHTFKQAEVCGINHWLPIEIFKKSYPEINISEDELTVISWVLPQTDITKKSLYKETNPTSERWARARVMGENVNVRLREYLVAEIQKMGHEAVSPMLSSEWTRIQDDKLVITSNWSERHIAYACGLGTFALCDGLITKKGKAARFGSLVVRAKLEPDERSYEGVYDYCLFFSKGICKACISRCPANAISEKGHDKIACREFVHGVAEEYVKKEFGFDGYGCGLCQTNVPCENKIP